MVLLSLLLLIPIALSLSNFPIVSTSYGKVRGYEYRAKNGFIGEIFKKIPFASPPIGPRRWKKPVPPEKWNYTVDGTFFGAACAQRSALWRGYVTGFSEDCLNLNVYSSKECRESSSSCPVILYIHGGVALFDGTMMFADEALITNFASQGKKSVIMVTTEYRLGVFGVMALGDENVLPANLAIHDVLEALRFTRKEIHNFGGDKDQISIMGHSTGATMVLTMAFSPGINKPGEPPLFARAIAMSGSTNYEDEEKQVKRSHDVAAKLGCEGSAQEIVDCMLPISTEDILDVAFKAGGLDVFSKTQLNDLTMAGELMPIKNVKELRENQKVTKLMLGTTLYEMEMKPFNTSSTVNNEVNLILGVKNEEECTEKYFADKKSGKFVSPYSGQSQAFFVTKWLFAEAQTKAGGEVYLYQYDYPAHAIHTDDVSYVMGFHDHAKDINEEWLSRTYPIYFANFAKGLPPAPDWKPVVPELMNYYSVNKSFTDGVSPGMKTGYHHDLNEYYKGIVQYDENVSKIKKKLLNAPVQYKELILLSTEPVNIRDILFYSIILGILLFLVFKFYQCWRERQRSAEESTLLIDRLNNNQ